MPNRTIRRGSKLRKTQLIMDKYNVHELVLSVREALTVMQTLMNLINEMKKRDERDEVIVFHLLPLPDKKESQLIPGIMLKRLGVLVEITPTRMNNSAGIPLSECDKITLDFLEEFNDY